MKTTTHTPKAPAIPDAPWTNADLLAFFKCGPTKLCDIKKDPAFPPPVLVCGLQRYEPAAIRAYFASKKTNPQEGTAS
ncbi:MAG: hypothetical protein K0M67_16420 [Thiobacillus sp.]|nr:hypothetical protein [Thiobacillus sp.]